MMTTPLTSPTIHSMALRYEEPPARRRGRQNIVRQLHLMTLEPKQHWGKAVRVAQYADGTVASVTVSRLKKMAAKPPGRWEFESGLLGDDEPGYGVWARYYGPEASSNG